MSLLGDPFDVIVSTISSALTGISGFFSSVFSVLGSILIVLGYLWYLLETFISIVLNPYLLATYILGFGFYYAVATAQTRKELLWKTGIYYKWIFETIPKIVYSLINITIKIIVGIIDMI